MLLKSWVQSVVRRLGRARKDRQIERDWKDARFKVTRLEQRRVLNASAMVPVDPGAAAGGDAGQVKVDAGDAADDGQADEFHVFSSGDETHVSVNDVLVFSAPTDGLGALLLQGSGDSDRLTIDLAGGQPVPNGTITFRDADGPQSAADRLHVTGGDFDELHQ